MSIQFVVNANGHDQVIMDRPEYEALVASRRYANARVAAAACEQMHSVQAARRQDQSFGAEMFSPHPDISTVQDANAVPPPNA